MSYIFARVQDPYVFFCSIKSAFLHLSLPFQKKKTSSHYFYLPPEIAFYQIFLFEAENLLSKALTQFTMEHSCIHLVFYPLSLNEPTNNTPAK